MTTRDVTIGLYLVLAAALVLAEVTARRGRSGIPTFGDLVRTALHNRAAQLGIVLTWWWLGWHFLLAL